MHGGVPLVVHRVHVRPSADEVLDYLRVAGDHGQVQRGVALLVAAVQQTRLGLQDLRSTT